MGTTTYISDDDKIKLLKDTVEYIQTNMRRITLTNSDPLATRIFFKRGKFRRFTYAIDHVTEALSLPFSLRSVMTQAQIALDLWNSIMEFGSQEGRDFKYHVSLLSRIVDLFKNHHDDVWTKEDGQKIYNITQRDYFILHPHHATIALSPRVPEPAEEPVESGKSGREHLNALLLQLKDLCE
jgi:hypothetical protein